MLGQRSNSNSRGSRRVASRAVGMFFPWFFSLFYCTYLLILGSNSEKAGGLETWQGRDIGVGDKQGD